MLNDDFGSVGSVRFGSRASWKFTWTQSPAATCSTSGSTFLPPARTNATSDVLTNADIEAPLPTSIELIAKVRSGAPAGQGSPGSFVGGGLVSCGGDQLPAGAALFGSGCR